MNTPVATIGYLLLVSGIACRDTAAQTPFTADASIFNASAAVLSQQFPTVTAAAETQTGGSVSRRDLIEIAPAVATFVAPQELNTPGLGAPANNQSLVNAGDMADSANAARFSNRFLSDTQRFDIGTDLYSPPDFEGGLVVYGRDVAMKIGGLVKADFIYDFDPIDSTDSFVTSSIPVGAPPRTNSRFHARQTRLSSDIRWLAGEHPVRVYVEGDFFSEGNQFRLRHAYGESRSLLVGQTWTTFTDVAAAPATLDFEGSVSNVNRRQAQARFTHQLFHEDLTFAVAAEDTQFNIETPDNLTAEARSPSPDFVSRIRLVRDWGQFQVAGLYRLVGAQAAGDSLPIYGDQVYTRSAWGTNFTGVILLTDSTKTYYQVLYGKGIGSYRDVPDAAPSTAAELALLPLLGWMVGFTHNWTDDLNSNFTYAENSLDTSPAQPAGDLQRTTYLAANLIWSPSERVLVGIEFLNGLRQNVDGGIGAANRLQGSVIFNLP